MTNILTFPSVYDKVWADDHDWDTICSVKGICGI